jgi:hypothetical protein
VAPINTKINIHFTQIRFNFWQAADLFNKSQSEQYKLLTIKKNHCFTPLSQDGALSGFTLSFDIQQILQMLQNSYLKTK